VSFRIQGLEPDQFAHLYGLSDEALAAAGAKRYTVDAAPGFPDRVEVRDLDVGDTCLLVNYEHLPVDTPYRSRHAIFVREGATEALDVIDEVPEVIRRRTISLRAFDDEGDMLHAELAEGERLTPVIERFLADPQVAYLHAHYATRGCYAARITRA
jgi:hypothetical protein